jgi:choline monooxygenase
MTVQVESLLGENLVAGFRSVQAIKKGLPSAAYTDAEFFKLEMKKVLAADWVLAGFVHELPTAGDARPQTVAGMPLVIVRDSAGQLRVFHNVCRHRGLKLVDQPCSGKKDLTCPYHGWMYNLDGKLLLAPHFGGMGKRTADGFDYEQHGLCEIRSAIWHDWIFVNIDGQAVDFGQFIEPLAKKISSLDLSQLTPILQIDSGEVRANWKFITENFVEPYHVPVTHPETAAGQPLKDHYMLRDRHLIGCGADVRGHRRVREEGNGRHSLCLDVSAWYLTLFPSLNFFVYFGGQIHIYVMVNTPLAPDRTHQRRMIYQLGGDLPSAAELEAWRRLNIDVVAEDWERLTRLQQGRASPIMADGGVLSPAWETSEHAFDELILEAVSK